MGLSAASFRNVPPGGEMESSYTFSDVRRTSGHVRSILLPNQVKNQSPCVPSPPLLLE